MEIFTLLEKRIWEKKKNIFSRFLNASLLIFLVAFSDYYTGFPLGIIQLNQLEQLEKISILYNSNSLEKIDKEKILEEQNQILIRYYSVSELRSSVLGEIYSTNNRHTAIKSINSNIKNSKTLIPNLFCSNIGYTISLSLLILMLIFDLLWNIAKAKNFLNEIFSLIFMTMSVCFIFLLLKFIPKFDNCFYNHILYFSLNVMYFFYSIYKGKRKTTET